ESYLEGVSEYIIKLSELTNGRCLVLFTSKEDLNKVNEHLYEYSSEFEIIRQHSGSSHEGVISSFTKSKGILLSTGSFGEGMDIKGKDLSQVISPRLPFTVTDPIIQYKTSLYDDKMEVLMPEMIMKWRQGIGRLIRTDSDKGIVSILDT